MAALCDVAASGGRQRRLAASDGVDVIETDASNCLNVPAEALMMEAPIRVHRVALHRDSGGPGTHRGGLGGVLEYELLDGEATVTIAANAIAARRRVSTTAW